MTVLPEGIVAMLHVATVPGGVHVPELIVVETQVVPVGTDCVATTDCASLGPRFVIVSVHTMLLPAV